MAAAWSWSRACSALGSPRCIGSAHAPARAVPIAGAARNWLCRMQICNAVYLRWRPWVEPHTIELRAIPRRFAIAVALSCLNSTARPSPGLRAFFLDHERAEYVRVLPTCRACQRQRDADLQALVDAGSVTCAGRAALTARRMRQRAYLHGSHVEGQRGDAVVRGRGEKRRAGCYGGSPTDAVRSICTLPPGRVHLSSRWRA
jgi:hypothetical protein